MQMYPLTHGSLFSGIGGFDLAAEVMGWDNLFNCEIDPFCRKILSYYYPNAEQYHDIRKTDFTIWRGRIDVLSGGFPCQPYSTAGLRKGKEDERHLWPEMLRAIREVAPRWVVGENVYGLVNWSGGLVFDEVCSDLENAGYEVQAYIIPACGVNAPHRRDRIWFVAYSDGCSDLRTPGQYAGAGRTEGVSERHQIQFPYKSSLFREDVSNPERDRSHEICTDLQSEKSNGDGSSCDGRERDVTDTRGAGFQKKGTEQQSTRSSRSDTLCDAGDVTNPNTQRRTEQHFPTEPNDKGFGCVKSYATLSDWNNFPTQSPICCGNDVFPGELDGITFPKWRQESIKGFGNAVVPKVVVEIFNAIQLYENEQRMSHLRNAP